MDYFNPSTKMDEAASRPEPEREMYSFEPPPPRRPGEVDVIEPSPIEQSRLFDLLGKINNRIIRGACLYLHVHGTVYRVLFGAYWQSVLTGVQHAGLRCTEVGPSGWNRERSYGASIELPLSYTESGWAVEFDSFTCMLSGELIATAESADLICVDYALSNQGERKQ